MTGRAEKRREKNDFGRFFLSFGGRSALLKDGVIYLPCPMDPQIATEIKKTADPEIPPQICRRGDRGPKIVFEQETPYVENIPWEGLVRHAHILFPRLARRVREKVQRELFGDRKPQASVASKAPLETALFEVLPRFVRLPSYVKSAESKRVALALWLSRRIGIPERFVRWAEDIRRDDGDSKGTIGSNSFPGGAPNHKEGWIVGVRALQQALEDALEKTYRESIRQEQDRLRETLRSYRDWPPAALGFMLFVLSRGVLEVDGYGFLRRDSDGTVVIYKRSGRYALRDYYNRLYLFPDCRVAVTSKDLWPVVMDSYKHPLLARHQPWQRICLGRSSAGRSFTAAHIIGSLEDGLNALYHGYDPRKRNGYHPLDQLPGLQKDIHFEDLKIPSDDPRCLSGEIPITNAFS